MADNKLTGRLTPRQKLALIRLVEEGKESVSSICRRYGISRKTFYKWRDRYLIAKAEKTKPLEALSPKKRTYLRQHPRRSANLFASEVLEVVKRRPSFSSRKIAKHVSLSEKGVRGVFRRLGLATQRERKRFQRLHLSFRPWLVAVFAVEYLLGGLFIPEIPLLYPLLVATPKKRRPVALYLPLLLLALLAFFKLNKVLFVTQLSFTGRMGLVLSGIALIFGMFFFLYSMKYYLTLALVLVSSRGINGPTGSPQAGPNGFLNGLRNGLNGFNGFNGRLNGRLNGLNGRLNGRLNGLLNGRFNGLRNGLNGINGLKNGLNGLNGINGLNGLNGRFNGLNGNHLNRIKLREKPFVSIHLPFYNEKRVAGRILEACTKLNYPNFEILVLDDSNDGTTEIVREWTKKDSRIRLVHRPNREGWKGGALRYALEKIDPRAEYVIVLDADFIPFPDTIQWFLRYFYFLCGGLRNVKKSKIAAVQGYQWHVLNKDENWITRGVRGEYAGSYIIERSGTELFGSLKQIAGSVYMIRADVLKEFGWGTSITEDFQLTLRLYEAGYKVIYTPYIQGPAECVATLKRLIRQRMRWAEGHTHNVRKMFSRLWHSPKMNLTEKLEFLYLSPYYLQSLFFLVGTIAWILADVVFRVGLPFWTATWGWSLVFTNMFSLLLMNAVGLFIEESDRKDYQGLLSSLAMTYLVVPFQAYAAIKGLFEKEEGHWFRTPKSGLITIEVMRGHFARLFGWLFPRRAGQRVRRRLVAQSSLNPMPYTLNPNFVLATAGNNFNNLPAGRQGFRIKRRRFRWVSKAALAVLLIFTVSLLNLTQKVPFVFAAQSENYYLVTDTDDVVDCPVDAASCEDMERTEGDGPAATTVFFDDAADIYYWYSEALPTGAGDASIDAGSWSLEWHGGVTGDCGVGGASVKVDIDVSHVLASDGSGATSIVTKNNLQLCDIVYPYTFTLGDGALQGPWTDGNERRLRLRIAYDSRKTVTNAYLKYDYTHAGDADSHVITPTMTIPENLVFFVAAPFIPLVVLWLRRRRGLALMREC